MTGRLTRKLDFLRKLFLSAVGLVVAAVPILLGPVYTAESRAKSQVQTITGYPPVYDVASIKPTKLEVNTISTMFKLTPDGFIATGVTLPALIQEAYGVQDNQILGTPRPLNSQRYDVQAKADGSVVDELRKLNPDQRKVVRQRMLQALLVDRFKLTLHQEITEGPVYVLVVARNGPKLREARPGDTYPKGLKAPDGGPGTGVLLISGRGGPITGQGASITSLVNLLSAHLGRTVVDKTGLTGKYDFTLQWTPDENQASEGGQPGIDNTPPPDSSGPSIFAAIQEQLGLKLESRKGPLEILVIDHAEKPSEN